jgi:hypothetical protein
MNESVHICGIFLPLHERNMYMPSYGAIASHYGQPPGDVTASMFITTLRQCPSHVGRFAR